MNQAQLNLKTVGFFENIGHYFYQQKAEQNQEFLEFVLKVIAFLINICLFLSFCAL